MPKCDFNKVTFIEITLRHGCPPVNLLHIFRTPFFKNTSGWLLLVEQLWIVKTRKRDTFRNTYIWSFSRQNIAIQHSSLMILIETHRAKLI